ncbi:MAG: SufD family Fe-S cluster assembly protein [Thermoplasmata archaeon]
MIDQINEKINTDLNDEFHEYRQDSFIQFMRHPPQAYKDSPTRARYIEFTEDDIQKMILGNYGGKSSYPPGKDKDVYVIDGNVYVNGKKSVIVKPMKLAEKEDHGLLQKYMDIEYSDDRIEYLINAGWQNGMFMHIPDKSRIRLTIENVSNASYSFAMKDVIIIGDDSDVEIQCSDTNYGDGNGVQGRNIYIFMGKRSKLVYSRIQDKSMSVRGATFMKVHMDDFSEATIFHTDHGFEHSILSTESYQYGTGTKYEVRGASFTDNDQQADIRDSTVQIGTGTVSNIIIRGIVKGKSVTMQRGNIDLREESKKSQGYYDTRILLLSKEAFANTKPALLINNNDTKSKHASAISDIDEESLFYLGSRGISRETAKSMIISGFVESVMEGADESMRNAVLKFSNLNETFD